MNIDILTAKCNGNKRLLNSILEEACKMDKPFSFYHRIYNFATSEDLSNEALQMMAKRAKTFNQWLKIHICAVGNPSLRKKALEEMTKRAKTFNQWLVVNDLSPIGSDLERQSLGEMKKLARNVDQWLKIFSRTESSPEEEQVYNEIVKTEPTFEQWSSIHDNSTPRSVFKTRALEEMIKQARTFNQWYQIFCRIPSDSELNQIAYKEMAKFV